MFLQRVSIYPQLGKEQDMRHHLEAWVKSGQGQGRKLALSLAMFSAEGTVFVINVRFNNLAEIEQMRQRQSSDQAFQDFLAKNSSLSLRPAKFELLEVLVPMPS